MVEGEANHVGSLPGLRDRGQLLQNVAANDFGDILGTLQRKVMATTAYDFVSRSGDAFTKEVPHGRRTDSVRIPGED